MRLVFRALRSVFSRARFERDMREELAAHIEHRTDDLVASGMRREEARRLARLEFGAIEAYKERCRDAWGLAPGRGLHGVGGDLKLASRRLLATPVFTVFAVLSLSIGVGVTTGVYSVLDRIFWKEMGIRDAADVVIVMSAEAGLYDVRRVMSVRDFEDLRQAQTSFAELSAAQQVFPAVAASASTEIQGGEAVDGQ